ncbi:DUF2460 domain-containing protein [Henriciella sp. AS95]|uniref:DUF2460 domain-containing protein n=1 Tax=Henriciella sp. AS95 TaxID=3135782 RepID=UPI00317BA9AB
MTSADFHDVLFPLSLGQGASGGPGWSTEVIALKNGAELRNAKWQNGRRRWDVSTSVSSLADLARLTDFFDARKGRLHGFRFRDMMDASSAALGIGITATDQHIGTGDGATTSFQLCKAYGDVSRPIKKPVADSVLIAIDGSALETGWTVEPATGLISFDVPPDPGAVITAGFEFDCAVRFDVDQLDLTFEAFGAGRSISVPIIELV